MKFLDKLPIKKTIVDEITDDSGAGTAFAMMFALICIGIGGLAIDASNVWSIKQRLQAATDTAAHAAAVQLVWPSNSIYSGTSAAVATAAILKNMPETSFGISIDPSDVVLAYWDEDTKSLTNSQTNASGGETLRAIAVTSRLDGNVGNVVPTFILKLIGFDYWEVATSSVFVRDTPFCVYGGFIANGEVTTTANDVYTNDFCLHGNKGVKATNNNRFGTGVRVTMPNPAFTEDGGMFAIGPNNTWDEGMVNQVGEDYISTEIATLASVEATIAELSSYDNPTKPSYITVPDVNSISLSSNETINDSDETTLITGAINIVSCTKGNSGKSGGTMVIPDGTTLSNMIIVTDCSVNFKSGSYLTNVTIATNYSGNDAALDASSGAQFGNDDGCSGGGGVSLFTTGRAHFAAGAEWFGTEVVATGDISMAAQASGVEGASFISNSDISITANAEFGAGACSGGIDRYKDLFFVRMVR